MSPERLDDVRRNLDLLPPHFRQGAVTLAAVVVAPLADLHDEED
jgi:hypothetical protein